MKGYVVAVAFLMGVFSTGLCAEISAPNSRAPRYEFEGKVCEEPDQSTTNETREVGYVYLKRFDDMRLEANRPMLEIPDPDGGHTIKQRAETIAERAEWATKLKPDWYTKLQYKMDPISKEYVLTAPVFKGKRTDKNERDEWLITLDDKLIKFLCVRHGVKKGNLLKGIRQEVFMAFDPDAQSGIEGIAQDLLHDHFINAMIHLKKGTHFYNLYLADKSDQDLNLETAISEYKQAVNNNPHYVHALRQLVSLYHQKGMEIEAKQAEEEANGIDKALPEFNKGNEEQPKSLSDSTADQTLDLKDIETLRKAVVHYKNAINIYGQCLSFYLMLADTDESLAKIEKNAGHTAAYNQYTADEKEALSAIPVNALDSGAPAFKKYVIERLGELNSTNAAP